MKKINQYFSIGFCVLLVLFSAVNLFRPAAAFSDNENRYLTQLPELNGETLVNGQFTNQFEKYTTDQFFGRDFWVSCKANMERITGKTENNGVYFCKDGYLIEKPPVLDTTVLDSNLNALKKLDAQGEYNIHFALIPTASEVLKEKLPAYAYQDVQRRVLAYNEERLKDTNIQLINPLSALEAHQDEYIYYRTDHHQTANGSFVTYQYLMEQLGQTPYEKEDFNIKTVNSEFLGTTWSKATVSVTPDEIIMYEPKFDANYLVEYADTQTVSESLYEFSKLEQKDKYPFYLDGNHTLLTINTGVKNGKSIAVYKDSYAHSVLPFLANHYENIHVLDLRYYNFNSLDYLKQNNITDILVLYNVTNFMTDTNLAKISAFIK